tara:strand:- start:26248 stop:26541 length:294 start_codon:yes stop_codon:yes gene_type:complete
METRELVVHGTRLFNGCELESRELELLQRTLLVQTHGQARLALVCVLFKQLLSSEQLAQTCAGLLLLDGIVQQGLCLRKLSLVLENHLLQQRVNATQ